MRRRRIRCAMPDCDGHMRLVTSRWLRCDRCGAGGLWERVACVVPSCRRTFKAQGDSHEEVCCGAHWRLAPLELRQQHAKALREHRKNYSAWEETPEGSEAQVIAAGRCDVSYGAANTLWRAIRSKILDTAGEIA